MAVKDNGEDGSRKRGRKDNRKKNRQIKQVLKANEAASIEKIKAADATLEQKSIDAKTKKVSDRKEKKTKRKLKPEEDWRIDYNKDRKKVASSGSPKQKSIKDKGKKTTDRKKNRQIAKANEAASLEKIKAADATLEQKSIDAKTKKVSDRKENKENKRKERKEKDWRIDYKEKVASGGSPDIIDPSVGAYQNIDLEDVTPTIDGKNPVTETEKNVVDKAKTIEEANLNTEIAEGVKNNIDFEKQKALESKNALSEALKVTPGDGVDLDQNRNELSGAGTSIGEVARKGTGKHTPTPDEFERMAAAHRADIAAAVANSPAAAIERMGIEHYYPPQQDFITSNFTGRYIGSRQLVASTGALHPEGLLDARKRANEAKVAAKLTAQENYWSLTSTTPQYDEEYKDIGMDLLNKYYELSGGDTKSLLRGNSELSRQFMRDMADYKSRGKLLIDVSTQADTLIETLGTGDEYVPPGVIEELKEFRSGLSDQTAYMKGETIGDDRMRVLQNSFRSYQNFTPLALDHLDMLKGLGANELPFAAGTDFSDPTFAANAKAAIESTKHRDYDKFVEVTSEFFDVKEITTIVENMYENNNLYEGIGDAGYKKKVEDGVRFFMANLPEVVDIETKFQNTNSLGWANLGHKERVWNQKKIWHEQEIITMLESVNNQFSDAEFERKMIEAHNSTTDPVRRAKLTTKLLNDYGYTPSSEGGYVSARLATVGNKVHSVNPSTLSVIGLDGKTRSNKAEQRRLWKQFNKPSTSANEKLAIRASIKELKWVSDRGDGLQNMTVGNRTITMGYFDDVENKIVPLETYNGSVDPKNLTNMIHIGGTLAIPTGDPANEDGSIPTAPGRFQYVGNHNIESDANRRTLGGMEGAADTVGFKDENETTVTDGSTISTSGGMTSGGANN